jgi:hypothetical protein
MWVRMTGDKLLTEKVHAKERAALARLDDAWAGLKRGEG